MKIIKLIFFLSVFSLSSHAQVGKVIAKEAGKEMVKSTVKSSVKKAAVKSTSKSIKKEIVEASLKKDAKKMAGNIVEKEAKIVASSTAAKTTSKMSAKAVNSNVAKTAAKKALKQTEKDALKVGTPKTFKSSTKQLFNAADEHFLRNTVAKSASNHAVRKVGMSAERKLLAKKLNTRAFEEWTKIASTDVAKDRILLNDLKHNPQLIRVLSDNPALLVSYNNMIRSTCRTDITMLRYAGYNADKYRNVVFSRASSKRAWLTGNDLEFIDKGGNTLIYNKNTKQILGTYIKRDNHEYIINISDKIENNPLMDMYPLNNTTYINGNRVWKTDKYGRVYDINVLLNGKIQKAGREKGYIAKVRDFKNDYDMQGNQKPPTERGKNDIAGHIIPDSWGGESSFLNIFPQNEKMNGKGLWRSSESRAANLAKNGHNVERHIVLVYSDKTSMRPISCRVTQLVDGQYQEIKGVVLKDYEFINPLVNPAT